MKNRRLLSTQIVLFAVAVLLVWLVVRDVSWRDILALFQNLQPLYLLGVVGTSALILILATIRWWTVLRGFGYVLPFWRTVRYRWTVTGLSYVTPGPQVGGEVLQIYYPTHHHRVPAAASIAATTVDKTLEFLGNFTFIAIGLVVMVVGQRVVSGADLYAMIAITPILLIPLVMVVLIWSGRHPFSGFITWFINLFPRSWRRWARNKRGLRSLPSLHKLHETIFHSEELMAWLRQHRLDAVVIPFVVTALALFLATIDFYLVTSALGMVLTRTQIIGSLTMIYFAYLLPVPGGLGALEAALVLSFTTFGYSPAEALSVALLLRARDMLQAALGLALGGYYSLRSAVTTAASENLLGEEGAMTLQEADAAITGNAPRPATKRAPASEYAAPAPRTKSGAKPYEPPA